MLLRINSFCRGHWGAPATVAMLVELLNKGVHPRPKARWAPAAIWRRWRYRWCSWARGRRTWGLLPGGALAAGLTAALGRRAWPHQRHANHDGHRMLAPLCRRRGGPDLEAEGQRLRLRRPHPRAAACADQRRAAQRIRRLTEGSGRVQPYDPAKVDAYSLRCIPQVHGAWRTWDHVAERLELRPTRHRQPAAVSRRRRRPQRRQFHGEPVAMALDYLAIGLAELASIAERRTGQPVPRGRRPS